MTGPLENPTCHGTTPETICALLTPLGRGAVAVIAIAGSAAGSILDLEFQSANRKTLSQDSRKQIVYGIWKATGEDVVVYRRGESNFEIHCHGGSSAPSAILEALGQSGVIRVSAHRFAREFENAWKVSMRSALAQATTTRTANYLLKQLEVFPAAIGQIESLVENGQVQSAIRKIETTLEWSDFGIHLIQPRSLVLCGNPNVGKSSLANSIIGFERAIVHGVPGTTRDVVAQMTAIDGWPVELKDTAGLRDTANTIEAMGIEMARAQIQSADLKICVFDLTTAWTESDTQTLRSLDPHLVVHNKSDLAPNFDLPVADRPEGILTSAETGQGIAKLLQEISLILVPNLPSPDQPLPVTSNQTKVLMSVLDSLRTGDISAAKTQLMHPEIEADDFGSIESKI